jgi:hypothetical protein
MDLTQIISLASLAVGVISVGANVGLYIHLSSVMHGRFESVNLRFDNVTRETAAFRESIERRLELMQGDLHNMDLRLTKLEAR